MSKSRNTRQVRPTLQTMDDRIVPATLIDLTSQGAQGLANGAIVQEYNRESARGNINGFLRIDRNGVEQGYNGDARPVQFDEASGRGRTHALRLNQVPTVNIGGVVYRSFLLDVQEPVNQSTISLDELRIYTSNSRLLTGYNAATKTLGGRTAVYDMDALDNVTVQIDANLNRGNGRGDVFVLIPNSAFAGVGGREFVTLYSKLGGSAAANGDFEEWSVGRVPRNLVPPPPPPPTGSSLSGFVFQDDDGDGIKDDGELAFAGVEMQLFNDLGEQVGVTVLTGDDGSYQFTGLAAGTYSIVQLGQPTAIINDEPVPTLDGANIVGSVGGLFNGEAQEYSPGDDMNPELPDAIININLGANSVGTNYNFLEIVDSPT